MALHMGALYDALIAGQVPEDQARKAAEEAVGCHQGVGLHGILIAIRRDLIVLRWMAGVTLLLTVGVAALVFTR